MTAALELLQDYTIQTVALGAALLGIIAGVLGSFAVLRRQSLLGDTLAHAALPGVCLGFLFAGTRSLGSMLAGAFMTGMLAALLVLLLTRHTRLKTDASLGIALSVFFALGIVLLTHIQGSNNASQGGLDSFLFGQAAAILRGDLVVMAAIVALAIALVAAFWKELKLVTFDPAFAASIGLPVVALEIALTVLTALAVVVGLQMVGVVLMAAMLIAPAVAARQWSRRFEGMVVLAAAIGLASGVFGAVVSATARGLATGPLIVLSVSAVVLVSLLVAPGRGMLWALAKRRRESRELPGHHVLTTLYRVAQQHSNLGYRAEQGTVDTYHGVGTRAALQRLERDGLVRPALHMPSKAAHWELTTAGVAAAERILDGLGRHDG